MSAAQLREWYLEDFEAGETCTTMGRTLTEADVMTVLESGELKGRKIGATWRIPRAAIDSYLS